MTTATNPPTLEQRPGSLRLYLNLLGTFTLFWWPLSHWFYPDGYHRLLGFTDYDYTLVKVIGTIGVVPVLCMFFAARDPLRNRDMVLTLLIFFPLLAATYIFLITLHGFPRGELFNVALLLLNSVLLYRLYPWKVYAETDKNPAPCG